ncbi:hypothetical protein B0J18DRAFT_371397 [Chaetomium sp. MPI-SDFR-AT-0129]|nr:hypothetical protein B0J18DRAFT_371397 [Chaetomium sp. MPI-SDFR-AT-0129]
MSGLEVIGVVISAVPIVTGFVKHFGSPRNAPRQVDRLSRMLAELRDERLLLAAMPAEQRHIHDMINRCTDVLERETGAPGTSQPNKIANRAFKFFWPAEAEKRLKEYNDELDRELDRLQRRVDRYRPPAAEGGLLPSAHTPHQLAIPRGSIWFEDEDLDDRSVSFLQAHDITIENTAGFTVYRCFSLYHFASVADRESFLVNVRERQLLGRFLVDKISARGELVAQQKVVRLWNKVTTAVGAREVIKTTVAFIGRDGKPYEKGLGEFRRSASLPKESRVELVEVASGMKLTLEFRRAGKGTTEKEKKGLFGGRRGSTASSLVEAAPGKTSDAAQFKKIFEANHPSTAGFSPLVLGSVGNPFDPDLGSITGEPLADSHAESALPALSPSTSRAPTLSSISIPSGSFYSAVEEVSPKSSPVGGG